MTWRSPIPPRRILAVDPGSEQSAWLEYEPGSREPVGGFGKIPNEELRREMASGYLQRREEEVLAIEMLRPRGMPTSWEEMLTAVWIGRLIEAWGGPWAFVFRMDEKLHLCGRANADDSNIRHAIADRFGGSVKRAKGTKVAPGPLYGIANDIWQALAVAITYAERKSRSDG